MNQTTNKQKLSNFEMLLFFCVFPVLYLMVFFTIVVAIIGANKDLTGFLGFVASMRGLIWLAIVPCLIATTIIIILILRERLYRSKNVTHTVIEAPKSTVTKEYIYITDKTESTDKDEEPAKEPEAAKENTYITNTSYNTYITTTEEKTPVQETKPVQETASTQVEPEPIVKQIFVKPASTPRPKPTLEEILQKVEALKEKRRVTANMIMPLALKLEKFKNKPENRDDAEKQAKIKEALNWCFDKLGNIEYKIVE